MSIHNSTIVRLFDFSFPSIEDLTRVLTPDHGVFLEVFFSYFLWTLDFNITSVKNTKFRCWVRIHSLPIEYWRSQILFLQWQGIEIPLALDEATSSNKFGYYARILVDLDVLEF